MNFSGELEKVSVTFAQALAKRAKVDARLMYGDRRLVFFVADDEIGRAMVDHEQGMELVSRAAVDAILGRKT